MSSEQTPLSTFAGRADPAPVEDASSPERPAWTPERDDRCQNCGGHVSEQFRKVCGDNDDRAHACPNCYNKHGVGEAASNPLHSIGGGER